MRTIPSALGPRGAAAALGRALALALALAAACTDDPYGGITFEGEFGEAIPFDHHSALIFVRASVDGVEGSYVVDTGAQFVLLDLDVAAGLGYRAGVASPLGELALGRLRFAGVTAVPYDLAPIEETLGVEIDGIIGASLLRYFTLVVDYQALTIALLDADDEAAAGLVDPAQVGPEAWSAGFELDADLGLALAEVSFDGAAPARLALDTGASATALFRSYYETLEPGDRPVVTDVAGLSATGAFSLDVTRFCEVAVGEALASDVHVGIIADEALGEVHELLPDLAGLVGATFLREFLTVLDYPGRTARFYRYADQSHVPAGEFVQVGLTLERDGSGDVVIAAVLPGTDAEAEGLEAGDRVLAIDGVPAAGLSDEELALAVRGEPGDTLSLEVDQGGSPRTVEVLVEDLLPGC